MAHISADRVQDTSTSAGTGNFTVSGTAPSGFRTLSAVMVANDTFYYSIAHQSANEWEVGLGTYTSTANVFSRTTIYSSSNAGSAVNFSAGTKDVFITLAASRTVQSDNSGNVGINTSSPGSTLDVKGTLRLSGAIAGYVGLSPASSAGSTTYTLPTADGSAQQVLTTNGSATLSWTPIVSVIEYVIDGGGSAITTGSKGYLEIPFACTINSWVIVADQSGSIVVDVKRATYSGFPTTSSIAGTNKPTLSSVQKNNSTSLTGWGNTAIVAGDILEFVVDTVATVQRVTVAIKVTRA